MCKIAIRLKETWIGKHELGTSNLEETRLARIVEDCDGF